MAIIESGDEPFFRLWDPISSTSGHPSRWRVLNRRRSDSTTGNPRNPSARAPSWPYRNYRGCWCRTRYTCCPCRRTLTSQCVKSLSSFELGNAPWRNSRRPQSIYEPTKLPDGEKTDDMTQAERSGITCTLLPVQVSHTISLPSNDPVTRCL